MATQDLGKTSLGMDANIAALLSYVLGWITGLIFFLVEKENKFVRFHAFQSILVFGAFSALQFAIMFLVGVFAAVGLGVVLPLFSLLNGLLGIAALILWVVLMIKAYQGEKFKLPLAGDLAEKKS